MELAVLTLFAVLLIGALVAGVPILYALIAGLILFSAYSLKCGFTLEQTGKMCLKGVNTVKNVRSSYRVMEIIRNDPGYCWLLCAADHTFRIFAAYLFVK